MPWTEKHARSLEATLKRMRERGPPGKLYNNDLNSEPEQSSEEEETDAESDGHISMCVPRLELAYRLYPQCDGS